MWWPVVSEGRCCALVRQVIHDMGDPVPVQQQFSLQGVNLQLLSRYYIVEFAQEVLLKSELRLHIHQLLKQLIVIHTTADAVGHDRSADNSQGRQLKQIKYIHDQSAFFCCANRAIILRDLLSMTSLKA